MSKFLSVIIAVVLFAGSVHADLLAGWDMNGLNGTNNNISAAFLATDIISGNVARGPGLLGTTTAGNSILGTSWTMGTNSTISDAVNSNDYFSITINANASLSITNFSWREQRSAAGPSSYTLRSSVDGFASDLSTWNVGGGITPQNVETVLSLAAGSTVEFRIYGFGASGNTGTGRIQDGANFGQTGIDLGIFGTVVPEPATFMLMGIGLVALRASRRKIRPLS